LTDQVAPLELLRLACLQMELDLLDGRLRTQNLADVRHSVDNAGYEGEIAIRIKVAQTLRFSQDHPGLCLGQVLAVPDGPARKDFLVGGPFRTEIVRLDWRRHEFDPDL